MNNKKYFIGISFVAILFIGLICHFKSTYVSRAISDHDIKMEGAIKKIVAENFKHDFPTLSLPHIFIDSSLIKTIRNDSLITVPK